MGSVAAIDTVVVSLSMIVPEANVRPPTSPVIFTVKVSFPSIKASLTTVIVNEDVARLLVILPLNAAKSALLVVPLVMAQFTVPLPFPLKLERL